LPFAVIGAQLTKQPYQFEPTNLEIIGAANDDNDGELLIGFTESLIAKEIQEKIGIAIGPGGIHNISEINGIGLYHLHILGGPTDLGTFKLWVYSYSICEMPDAPFAIQYKPESAG